ncbi:2-dehydropantoate 2-reductase [Aliidongia dinghuensis]|uniref:2-dehydropantoate 2-reductase n=1 Tax=Aliidongia dinghuensis TaxID=1867774 RepID=A0A8J2YQN2_9PROT|nr:ketopantoate reductase family protein [Aliidongia dinghuensis]GGF05740.1 2-dehydropantoate 2-reductase [Aliidongia dinghuensis]
MRILIVGAGSTGGYFGGRLALTGRDVTFLVRPTRAERLREAGLEIVSPHGNFTLAPSLVTAGQIDKPYDVVLLTVKGFGLDAALDDLAPAIGPETMILPVLNGMKHVETLEARFGPRALVGCVCKVATHLDDAGRIVQLTPLHELAYGEMDGAPTARVAALDRIMQGAGFDARLSSAIAREMWEKWILLATIGGVTCLMRGNIGAIEAVPGGADFALAFLDEVTAIVRAVGVPPSDGFLKATRPLVTQHGSPLTSSMYRDLEAGRAVEVEQILGDLLARGQRAGLATPLVHAATTHLRVYQNRVAPR